MFGGAEPGEGLGVLNASGTHGFPEAGVGEQVADAVRKVDGFVRVHETSGLGLSNVDGEGPDGGCDDGPPACHGFEGDEAETFVERGNGAEVCGGVEVDELLLRNGGVPGDAVGDAEVGSEEAEPIEAVLAL